MVFPSATILHSRPLFQQSSLTLVTTAIGLLVAISYFAYIIRFPKPKPTDIRQLGGFSFLTVWSFFDKRHDFLTSNFDKLGERLFTFKVLQYHVTAARGEDARRNFLDNKSLDSQEGYKLLMGAAPRLDDIDTNINTEDVTWFNKSLITLLNRARLAEVIPALFDDAQRQLDSWGQEGKMDPFTNIYDLVFQLTVRMTTCGELSNDLDAINRLQGLYWTLEKSATPASLLLPWFPSPAKRRTAAATKELFATLDGYVDGRRAADVPTADAIDAMLAEGNDNPTIIKFILGAIFAGTVNTGINASWILVYLAYHQEWKRKMQEEVQALIKAHTDTTSSERLHKRLSAVPIEAWEDEMPTFEAALKETLRLALNGTLLRRNVHEDLIIGDKILPKGNFLAYSVYDIHMNPDIYTNPMKFDPNRFSPGREEDKKEKYAYLAWGAGRHPCTGMKVAKLEIKIIVALFVAGYEFDIIDSTGKFPKSLPKSDYNDIQKARPCETYYLKFKRAVD